MAECILAGRRGEQGPKGDQGIQGVAGPTGPQGSSNVMWITTASSSIGNFYRAYDVQIIVGSSQYYLYGKP